MNVRGEQRCGSQPRFAAGPDPPLPLSPDLERAAALDTPVLVVSDADGRRQALGRAIHDRGARAPGPWLLVTWAEDGGVTMRTTDGADSEDVTGLRACFRLADGGTLFVDNVAAMSTLAQQELLTLLDAQSGWPADRSDRPLVRVVAGATSRLYDDVRAGRFSERLFYRLNVYRLDDEGVAGLDRRSPADALLPYGALRREQR